MSTFVEILVPEVGESITGGQILTWFKQNGETVKQGDPLFELETDKITLTVPAEYSGVLNIHVPVGADVLVGQKVATLDASESASRGIVSETSPVVTSNTLPLPTDTAHAAADQSLSSQLPSSLAFGPQIPKEFVTVSPSLSPSPSSISQKVGRILKEESLSAIQNPAHLSASQSQPSEVNRVVRSDTAVPSVSVGSTETQTRKRMSPIRKRIAERLVEAQQTAAMLTTFNEVDMSSAMRLRQQYQDAFSKKHGIKLGFMSFFVKAVVSALQACPELNAFIYGDDIVYNHDYHIGIAVGTDRGLVVPVIRNAERMGFSDIEAAIADLAQKAKDKKLSLDDLTGGTFSITNGGIYGSLLSTPILNPPQSGILGMHGIKKRPIVVDDSIVIRPMMYLALSYDHRIVDGSEAVTFLRRVCDCIENPEKLLFGL